MTSEPCFRRRFGCLEHAWCNLHETHLNKIHRLRYTDSTITWMPQARSGPALRPSRHIVQVSPDDSSLGRRTRRTTRCCGGGLNKTLYTATEFTSFGSETCTVRTRSRRNSSLLQRDSTTCSRTGFRMHARYSHPRTRRSISWDWECAHFCRLLWEWRYVLCHVHQFPSRHVPMSCRLA